MAASACSRDRQSTVKAGILELLLRLNFGVSHVSGEGRAGETTERNLVTESPGWAELRCFILMRCSRRSSTAICLALCTCDGGRKRPRCSSSVQMPRPSSVPAPALQKPTLTSSSRGSPGRSFSLLSSSLLSKDRLLAASNGIELRPTPTRPTSSVRLTVRGSPSLPATAASTLIPASDLSFSPLSLFSSTSSRFRQTGSPTRTSLARRSRVASPLSSGGTAKVTMTSSPSLRPPVESIFSPPGRLSCPTWPPAFSSASGASRSKTRPAPGMSGAMVAALESCSTMPSPMEDTLPTSTPRCFGATPRTRRWCFAPSMKPGVSPSYSSSCALAKTCARVTRRTSGSSSRRAARPLKPRPPRVRSAEGAAGPSPTESACAASAHRWAHARSTASR
mmetsp:Transcript_30112/g.65711  ORF Transcript_30112/g.65711 Transcript_30112/m.65711 type:complete len:393 (-) Transcript_30112:1270-2448(-)